jgi:hypothetical protein
LELQKARSQQSCSFWYKGYEKAPHLAGHFTVTSADLKPLLVITSHDAQ